MTFSQERIFKLLGMKTSFYVTPEIKENLIEMTFRRNEDGVLEKWDKQLKVTEQDPAKCAWKLFTLRLLSDSADEYQPSFHSGVLACIPPLAIT